MPIRVSHVRPRLPDPHSLGKNRVLMAAIGNRLTRYRFGWDTGLTAQHTLEMPLDVQYACFHPHRPIIYVACSNGGVATPGDRHCLVALALEDAEIRIMAKPVELPYRPLHVALDIQQRRVALAYNRPAAVSVHELDEVGVIQNRRFLLEGVDLAGYFPHQVLPMPDCCDLLLTCRGDDATASRAENPGSLRVLRAQHNAMTCVQIVSPNNGFGFGPRNCAFHPNKCLLYAVLERQNKLAVFRHRNGSIDPEPSWTVQLLENTNRRNNPQLGGAIIIHPNGRFAYVVNRAHPLPGESTQQPFHGENSIVVFRLNGLTGAPEIMQRMALNGLHARCIALSEDGMVLIAAFRQAGRISGAAGIVTELSAGFACFRVLDSGHLSLVNQQTVDVGEAQLFWADFAPDPEP